MRTITVRIEEAQELDRFEIKQKDDERGMVWHCNLCSSRVLVGEKVTLVKVLVPDIFRTSLALCQTCNNF